MDPNSSSSNSTSNSSFASSTNSSFSSSFSNSSSNLSNFSSFISSDLPISSNSTSQNNPDLPPPPFLPSSQINSSNSQSTSNSQEISSSFVISNSQISSQNYTSSGGTNSSNQNNFSQNSSQNSSLNSTNSQVNSNSNNSSDFPNYNSEAFLIEQNSIVFAPKENQASIFGDNDLVLSLTNLPFLPVSCEIKTRSYGSNSAWIILSSTISNGLCTTILPKSMQTSLNWDFQIRLKSQNGSNFGTNPSYSFLLGSFGSIGMSVLELGN